MLVGWPPMQGIWTLSIYLIGYDALVSKRSYKDEWENSRALELIGNQAASQFDPELVELA